MKIQPLRIGTKTAKVPVIQGGMGVGISLGNLAGAVAKEGGIGIISAAQPGFREEDFIKDPLSNANAVYNKYPSALPGVFHRRAKPYATSARVTSRWYGLTLA